MTTRVVRFLNVILAAVLAGVSFGIWLGFSPGGLSLSTYVEQQRHMLESLRVLMVALVILATIITLISAFMQRRNRGPCMGLLAAAALFVACIVITRFGNKPIDDQVLTWTTASLPDNWMALRDKWWTLHRLRTTMELGGLLIITWVSVKKEE